MMRTDCHKALHLLAALFTLMTACTGGKEENKDDATIEMHPQQMSETYVDTMTLHQTVFNKQLVCNGRLRAKAKSELHFKGQGTIAEVLVREGQHVGRGQLIATLDRQDRLRDLEKAEHETKRAQVELTDKLIGLGYDDMSAIPADVMERAEVMSGYYAAKFQLQAAKKALEDCNLYAPFSGRIADLEAKCFQKNDKVCTLIDDSGFEVEFRILEAELPGIHAGQQVRVTPFAQDSIQYEGRVTEINPLVDDKGLVRIKAQLSNRGNTLLDGMNVRVIVEERMQHMFVVPKDAVVERDGYQVVFLLAEGKAVWTYVDVVHSNISSFAITGCQRKETTIKEGDIVITSGNLNLADGTEVIVNGQ